MDGELKPSDWFTCECKQQSGWIFAEGITDPCPICGRIYKGRYNKNSFRVEAVQLNWFQTISHKMKSQKLERKIREKYSY